MANEKNEKEELITCYTLYCPYCGAMNVLTDKEMLDIYEVDGSYSHTIYHCCLCKHEADFNKLEAIEEE